MSPGKISKRVVADRLNWINKMIQEIKSLPIEDYDSFALDKRNSFAAESCLRRSLEALMDLGRHILAKGFSHGVSEYKEIERLHPVWRKQAYSMQLRALNLRPWQGTGIEWFIFITRYQMMNYIRYAPLSLQI